MEGDSGYRCSLPSFGTWVFLIMIWHTFDFVPTVAARCIESLRARVPGCPKICPAGFNSSEFVEKISLVTGSFSFSSVFSALDCWRCDFQASSSFGEQALSISSHRRLSDSKTIFHEKSAVWHC